MGCKRNSGVRRVEDGLTISLGPILRARRRQGPKGAGILEWQKDGHQTASMGVYWNLTDPENAHVTLIFTRAGSDGAEKEVRQRIRLVSTTPNYGGGRWWMICPRSGRRVAKLHLPPGEYEFASRNEWGLSYRSQRATNGDRPFDKLFRLQRSLGSPEGWYFPLVRPKGMWKRTYGRHLERYRELHRQCSPEIANVEALRERFDKLSEERADEPNADPSA